jgi:hypothetical protein
MKDSLESLQFSSDLKPERRAIIFTGALNSETTASSNLSKTNLQQETGAKKMTSSGVARAVGLSVSMGLLFTLAACSSQSIKLIHPHSGATAECSASGFAIGASIADGMVGGCSRAYEERGYVLLDQLQPNERASLERRGLLPKN